MSMWRCLEFLINVFYSLSDIANDIVVWLDTTTISGDTYGELLFGSGLTLILGWLAVSKLLDIWPG